MAPEKKRRSIASVSVAEAKTHLSELLGRVAYGGESVLIVKRGRPMARLVPATAAPASRHLADVRGWLDDDDPFFAELGAIVLRRRARVPRAVAERARK